MKADKTDGIYSSYGPEKAEELKLLENMSRDFAINELREGREERDTYPYAPLDLALFHKAEELGYFTLLLDEPDEKLTNQALLGHVLTILSMEDASLAGAVFAHSLAQMIIIQAGQAAMLDKIQDGGSKAMQKKKESPFIAFPCFDFPDNLARGLRAEKKDEKYFLSGEVNYVTLGNLASWALLPAQVEGKKGFSFFLCPLGDEKVTDSFAVLSLGLRSCPAVDLAISDAEAVPVGDIGAGEIYYEAVEALFAALAASISLGVMKGSYREALDYSRQRVQGGREIINWSELRMMLSRAAVQCRTSEMLVNRALHESELGIPGWEDSARAAALHVQEAACHVTSDGIQILGGNGYMQDYGQEKRFRDAHQLKVLLGHHPLRKLEYIKFAEELDLS